MVAALTTITKLIQFSPELANAGLCFSFVWGFFKLVGDLLPDKTNWKIARWIRVKSFETGVVADEAANWPKTFAEVFDRVFGEKHWSISCFFRSALASSAFTAVGFFLTVFATNWRIFNVQVPILDAFGSLPLFIGINVVPDYFSLLETRYALRLMERYQGAFVRWVILIVDILFTGYLAIVGFVVLYVPYSVIVTRRYEMLYVLAAVFYPVRIIQRINSDHMWVLVYPAFFTSIWLWLYAGAGFLLKFVLGFAIVFNWFNRTFDIKKKPLQCIAPVAGAMAAVLYWAVVIVSRVVG